MPEPNFPSRLFIVLLDTNRLSRESSSGLESFAKQKTMKAWICFVIAISLNSAFSQNTCGNNLTDVGTSCEFPKKLVLVSAPNQKRVDLNNCNSEYEKSEWQEQPSISYPEADPVKTYTLVNVDPDPPGYDNGEFYLHWLVSNIRGEDFAKGDLSNAKHLQEYYGPNPPAGSGLHRYMFLAFEEKEKNRELEYPTKRAKFELIPWFKKQDNLCGPVAGIQFRTKF